MTHDSLTPDQLEVGKTYDITHSYRVGDDVDFFDARITVVAIESSEVLMVRREYDTEDVRIYLNPTPLVRLHSIKEVTP